MCLVMKHIYSCEHHIADEAPCAGHKTCCRGKKSKEICHVEICAACGGFSVSSDVVFQSLCKDCAEIKWQKLQKVHVDL